MPSARTAVPDSPLNRWLELAGLGANPFGTWSAEREKDLSGYYVDPGILERLLTEEKPCVVLARRGSGKTACRHMLAHYCRPLDPISPYLAIHYAYASFERVLLRSGQGPTGLDVLDHVREIVRLALAALDDVASADAVVGTALVQPPLAASLASCRSLLAQSWNERPGAWQDAVASLDLLKALAGVLQGIGLESCVVLIDGVDESPLTSRDLAQAVAFLQPLLGTLPVIECPGWAFRFFLPSELPLPSEPGSWYRRDRLHIQAIDWDAPRLRALLGARLTHYSKRQPPYEDIAELCQDDLKGRIEKELIGAAGLQPRAVLRLADSLLQIHCRLSQPSLLIARQTWEQALARWRREEGLPYGSEVPVTVNPSAQALRIDMERGLVYIGEQEIRKRLRPQDYAVLLALFRHRGEVCSKDQLARDAWPDAGADGVSDEAMAAAVARLRTVLDELAPGIEFIETIRGKAREQGGYRCV